MATWYSAAGGFEHDGMDAMISGNWGSRPDVEFIPDLSYRASFAGDAIAPSPARHDTRATTSPYQNSLPSAAPSASRPPFHTFCPPLIPPTLRGVFDDDSLRGYHVPSLLSLTESCVFSPLSPCPFNPLGPLPGTGFSTSPTGPAAAPQALPTSSTSTIAPDPTSLLATSTTQPPPVARSSLAVHDAHFATLFTPLDSTANANAPPTQHDRHLPSSTASSAPSFPPNLTAIGTSLLDCTHQLPPRLSQSSTEANDGDALNFAGLATADSASTRHGSLASLFSSPIPWTYQSSSLAGPRLPSSNPRTVTTLHEPYPGPQAQGEAIILAAEPHGRALDGDARIEERGYDNNTEEGGRIPVDSLLDAMPPTNHRKRTRTAAVLDEPAGPSNVKRSRSHSSRASISGRPASSKSRRSLRGARSVAIPDSDDVFVVDDEEDSRLYDLTKDDRIPEELMAAPKDDNSTRLSSFECIICMDSATNLTVTHCGHLFCGQCLHQAMHAEVTKKICPMCRQKLELRPKTGGVKPTAKTFFHLELKLKPTKKQGKQPVRR